MIDVQRHWLQLVGAIWKKKISFQQLKLLLSIVIERNTFPFFHNHLFMKEEN